MTSPATHRSRAGFTMIEILLVLAIIGILVAIGMPLVQRYIEKSRLTTAIVEVGELAGLITKYERTRGALPTTLTDIDNEFKVAWSTRNDPWGKQYQYFNLRTSVGNGQARKDKKLAPLNSDFDLYSMGADGQTAAQLSNAKSRDDVVRARDGAFIGTAEEFDP